MTSLPPGLSRLIVLLGFLLVCLVYALWIGTACSNDSRTAGALPLADPDLTPQPCATAPACSPQERVYGYQPRRYETVRPIFNAAASNLLGTGAPAYFSIVYGTPPALTLRVISSDQPIPHVILRAVGWAESRWKQFANSKDNDPDNLDLSYCTLISETPCPTTGNNCSYGLSQILSGMDGSAWFEPTQVAGDLVYNLGTGTNMLVDKWNWMVTPTPRIIGSDDHTMPADWYYAVTAYNGWTADKDPNSNAYDPSRPPYKDKPSNSDYPYQEVVWGWMAHPQKATAADISHWLWRPTRIPWVPRGIWGLGGWDWRPSQWSPIPVFYLLYDVQVVNGGGPSIVLHNPTAETLAVDVAFYNTNNSFNKWWLDPDPTSPPWYVYPYIRLAGGAWRTLNVADAFVGSDFSGYARVTANEDLEVTLLPPPPQLPPTGYHIFLPVAFRDYEHLPDFEGCDNQLSNGEFEQLEDGQPASWTVASADDYSLADGTWFRNGHYGAYLGGYDDASDSLEQWIWMPGGVDSLTLVFSWYITSTETIGYPYDYLYVVVYDSSNNEIVSKTLSNLAEREGWHTAALPPVPSGYANHPLRVVIKATTDSYSKPTSFFVDDVKAWACYP